MKIKTLIHDPATNLSITQKMLLLIAPVLILFLNGCISTSSSEKSTNLKAYYFPYEDLFEPKFYKFQDLEDPENIQYWQLETKVIQDDTVMLTLPYDNNFRQFEIFIEKFDAEGASVHSFTMLGEDENIITQPNEKTIILWDLPKEKEITWSVEYESQFGFQEFMKSRELIGKAKPRSFDGKLHPTVKFKDSYQFYNSTVGESYEYHQNSYYSKGVGLVEYEREFPDRTRMHFKLIEIFSEQEWNKLKESH